MNHFTTVNDQTVSMTTIETDEKLLSKNMEESVVIVAIVVPVTVLLLLVVVAAGILLFISRRRRSYRNNPELWALNTWKGISYSDLTLKGLISEGDNIRNIDCSSCGNFLTLLQVHIRLSTLPYGERLPVLSKSLNWRKISFRSGQYRSGNCNNYEGVDKKKSSLRPHPNICQIFGFCTEPHQCIVLEYISGGNLMAALVNNRIQLTGETIEYITHDIACAMLHLHVSIGASISLTWNRKKDF